MKTANARGTVTIAEYTRLYGVIERALHPYKRNGLPDPLTERTTERALRALGFRMTEEDKSPA
jgi:hypothetical protein